MSAYACVACRLTHVLTPESTRSTGIGRSESTAGVVDVTAALQITGIAQTAVSAAESSVGMSGCIVAAADSATYVVVAGMGITTPAIAAIRMIVMESVDMMPIVMHEPAIVVAPVGGVIIPIPG